MPKFAQKAEAPAFNPGSRLEAGYIEPEDVRDAERKPEWLYAACVVEGAVDYDPGDFVPFGGKPPKGPVLKGRTLEGFFRMVVEEVSKVGNPELTVSCIIVGAPGPDDVMPTKAVRDALYARGLPRTNRVVFMDM